MGLLRQRFSAIMCVGTVKVGSKAADTKSVPGRISARTLTASRSMTTGDRNAKTRSNPPRGACQKSAACTDTLRRANMSARARVRRNGTGARSQASTRTPGRRRASGTATVPTPAPRSATEATRAPASATSAITASVTADDDR